MEETEMNPPQKKRENGKRDPYRNVLIQILPVGEKREAKKVVGRQNF
jgi:hypothetical protein